MNQKIPNIKYVEIALPILASILLIGIFLFISNSVHLVAESNKNNFTYNLKIRNATDKINKIIERAQVNVNILTNAGYNTYDINKQYDKKYNEEFIKRFNILIKSALMNTPGINGAWYQSNNDLPFANNLYCWYVYKNGQYVDMKDYFDKYSQSIRNINKDDDPYYFNAVENKALIWSEIYTDKDINVQMITVSEPIYKNGKLIGVVGLDVSLQNLQSAMTEIQKIFEKSDVLLINNKNEAVITQLRDKDRNLEINKNLLPLLKNTNGKSGDTIEYLEHGAKRVAVILKLACEEYRIAVSFPNNLLFKGFSKLFKMVYFNFLLLIIMTIVILLNLKQIKEINKEIENRAKKLEIIFESSPNIIVVKDTKGRYISCNNKFLSYLDVKKEDLLGKVATDVFPHKLAQQIIDMENVVKETNKIVVYEACHKKANGSNLYLKKHVIPLFDINNNLVEILITAVDITKNKEEHKLLKAAKESAEQNAIMKTTFLANMSHEIRTPLNGVLGFIQLLKDTKLDNEQIELLNDTEKASEILLNIINDILDISKIEADKLLIEEISFDIRALVEDLTVLSATNAEKKGIDLGSIIYSNVPQRVYGDPGRVRQILNNFISNAIKFTHQGEIMIYVSQIKEDNKTSFIKFEVKDTGIGIPKSKINLIFDEFTQADASTTRKFGGTGLGLAISKKLIKMMNGDIQVISQEGEGTTFIMTMPFKIDNNIDKSEYKSFESLSGVKILLINDKPTDLKIINHYLSETDCVVYSVNSCKEAIKVLCKEQINLIIVDYKMQKTCEHELATEYENNSNKDFCDIPLILYTSLAIRGDSIWAKEKGFKGYLTKPIKKFELIETISAVITENELQNKFITKHVLNENKFDKKIKILVAEDSEINCKLISKVLTNHGLYADFTNNGQDAVDSFCSKKYDLILMDCQMPVLDGYAAAQKIRELEGNTGKHIPIVAITANVLDNEKEKCLSAGMDAYISKPINIEELLNLISNFAKPNDSEIVITDANEIDNIANNIVSQLGLPKNDALELVIEALRVLPESVNNLKIACNNNDTEQMKKIAHKLKGSSSNLRVDKVAELSANLMDALKIGRGHSEYLQIIEDMSTYFEFLDNEYKKYKSQQITSI